MLEFLKNFKNYLKNALKKPFFMAEHNYTRGKCPNINCEKKKIEKL